MTADSTDVRAASPTSCKPLARRPPITKSRGEHDEQWCQDHDLGSCRARIRTPRKPAVCLSPPARRRVPQMQLSSLAGTAGQDLLTPTRPSSALPAAATARRLIPRARRFPPAGSEWRPSGATPGRLRVHRSPGGRRRAPRHWSHPRRAMTPRLGNRVRQGRWRQAPRVRTASRR